MCELGDSMVSRPGDASQRELVRVAALSAAQLESALQESDAAVGELGAAVAGFVASAGDEAARTTAVADAAQRLVVALQFYDRLSQRLRHVRDTLDSAAVLGALRDASPDLEERWTELHARTQATFSMAEEHRLLELIESGRSTTEALRLMSAERGRADSGSTVELF